jgi:hypothetical protein
MNDVFIGGVANITMYKDDQIFATAKTLLTSSITLGVTAADVRGGMGNGLIGKYFHTSKFDIKIEDCLFKMQYIAANIGSDIIIGSDVQTVENVTLATGLTGATKNTAVDFAGFGTIGWVSLPGMDDWHKVVITGKAFTSPVGTVGGTVCIKYKSTNSSAETLTVSSNIIPATLRIIMEAELFAGGKQAVGTGSGTKLGSLQIEIPKFILDGGMQIDMTSAGVSKTPLNGSALTIGSETCDGDGTYGTITKVITNANWYDDVNSLSISDSEVDLSTAAPTQTLNVIAVHTTALPSIPPYADLIFTSSDATKATVSATGLVTKVAIGNCQISVAIAAHPTVVAVAEVTIA